MSDSFNHPMGAIRSSSLLHVDEEIDTAFQEAYKQEHPQEENEDIRAMAKVAALENHPGWKIIREKFLDRIEAYRSGFALVDEIANYNLTDAQIGQMTRNMHLIAGELTGILNEVTLAVETVEGRKQEQRNGTRQNMGQRTQRQA